MDENLTQRLSAMEEKLQVLIDVINKPRYVVYTNATLKERLGVGDKLIKSYRDSGYLPYSKVGDKFFYTDEDLEVFLKRFHKDSF